MAANFIFEGPNKMRVTSLITTTHYDVGDLNFYVSTTAFGTKCQAFMVLRSDNGLYEIVELVRAGASGQNILYKLPINQKMRVGNEEVQLQMLVIDTTTGLYYLSSSTRIHVTTEHYTLARQVYIAQEVGATVQDCYARTLALLERIEQQEKGDKK